MRVIIPVAGEGTRLRPHTHTTPKPLIHVGGKAILGHILDQLSGIKFSEVVFVVGTHADQIESYVRENYSFPCRFVEQTQLFGLGYAVHLGIVDVNDEYLVILGDTIVELDWPKFISAGKNYLVVKEVDDPRAFGVVEAIGERITRLVEKPKDPPSNLAVVGVYYIKDTVEFHVSLSEVVSRGLTSHGEIQVTDAFELFLRGGGALHTFPTTGWHDCGRKETILETNRHLLARNQVAVKREGSIVILPVFIDSTAEVEHSVIGPYVSIAAGSIVRNSIIKDSIISIGAEVDSAILENSLIGNYAIVREGASSYNVGDSSEVGRI